MGKYKNIIYFIGITVILLLACGITDVIHYYANQLQLKMVRQRGKTSKCICTEQMGRNKGCVF